MDLKIVLFILLSHFVGDFLLQTNWMALGKSTKWKPLIVHTAVYSASLLPLIFYSKFAILVIIFNGILHGYTDYLTSRWSAKYYQAGRIRHAFAVLGLDQLIHYVCLFTSFGAVL